MLFLLIPYPSEQQNNYYPLPPGIFYGEVICDAFGKIIADSSKVNAHIILAVESDKTGCFVGTDFRLAFRYDPIERKIAVIGEHVVCERQLCFVNNRFGEVHIMRQIKVFVAFFYICIIPLSRRAVIVNYADVIYLSVKSVFADTVDTFRNSKIFDVITINKSVRSDSRCAVGNGIAVACSACRIVSAEAEVSAKVSALSS